MVIQKIHTKFSLGDRVYLKQDFEKLDKDDEERVEAFLYAYRTITEVVYRASLRFNDDEKVAYIEYNTDYRYTMFSESQLMSEKEVRMRLVAEQVGNGADD